MVDLNKEEEHLIEYVKELIYGDEKIMSYINQRCAEFWPEETGTGQDQCTPFQEEFMCQVQVQLVMNLLAKVMVS